jgi:cytochrome d ubiquinol oxidase subunit II
MLVLIIIILATAFILYTLLGGADFGAGIIETFAGRGQQSTISKAIAPVWEANHVWLILAVVILFTGFPAVYSSLSLVLHIPLLLVLIGIIFRGSAFTFRYYDVKKDHTHKYFTALFKISSFITPIFLGMTLGALIFGAIDFNPAAGFYAQFVAPWLNLFCFAMGLFSTSLFAYIAAVFLIGETKDESEFSKYRRIAKKAALCTILMGLLVFVIAELEHHHLLRQFLRSPISVSCLVIAGILIPFIFKFINSRQNTFLRAAIGLQVTAILIGWFAIQFPVLIKVKNGEDLTFFNTQAPASTQLQLLIALIVGLIVIIPAFIYLFRVFKKTEAPAGRF